MKKNLCRNILLYLILAIVCFYQVARGKVTDSGEKCLSDILCDIAHYGKYRVYPFLIIVMIGYFKDFFRSAVILRYKQVSYIIGYLLKRSFILSISVSFLQTGIACLVGMRFSEFASNWQSWDSYVAHAFGNIVEKQLPTIAIILLYFYVTLVHVFIMCSILWILWYLTENPMPGFVLAVIILIYESATKGNVILFNVISMEESKIIFGTVGAWELLFYPMLLIAGIIVVMGIIIRNKDFMRLT